MVLSTEKNLYDILEIPFNANSSTIKSAYRKLARKFHPDLNDGDKSCVNKFKEITEAYEILSDETKKKNYDILHGIHKETSKTKYTEANKAYKEAKKEDEDIKASKQSNADFSNVLNDILSGFKKTTGKTQNFKTKQNKPEKGSDVYSDVIINLSESLQGTTRTINIVHTEICPNCEGRTFLNGVKCPLCQGLGEQSSHKKITVKIPPNIKHGSKIRIANEGNKGYNGGKNGDLYLNIRIESPSSCKYEGLNIHCNIPITPYEAVLGASIEIPTPNGKISMKIAPGTQSGQKFRLAEHGINKDGKIGDMIVTVNIEVPTKPSEKEIQLYKELQNNSKQNIRE